MNKTTRNDRIKIGKRIMSLILWVALFLLSACSGLNIKPVGSPETVKDTDANQGAPGEVTNAEDSVDGPTFEVHFLDVGQGDAALILCDGEAMLIDGGASDKSDLLYAYLKKEGIDHLKYVIVSHPEEDHVGGLSGALHYATVDVAYTLKMNEESAAFNHFLSSLEKQNVEIQIPEDGTSLILGAATATVFRPKNVENRNASFVVRVEFGDTSFLFTGDAEFEEEQELVDSGVVLQSTVLKVGHHGSDTSTTDAFMNVVLPEYAVISCGQKNDYGHPMDVTLNTLKLFGVTLFRTDMQGDIICTSDGKDVTFTTERNKDADTYLTYYELYREETTDADSADKAEAFEEGEATRTYILNTSSYKFHNPDCKYIKDMKDYNKMEYTGTRDEILAMGYDPCGVCHP